MRPTLSPGPNSVAHRSMVVYEGPDDFGAQPTDDSANNGSMGNMIACCNVQPFTILDRDAPSKRFLEDEEEGVEVLTFEDYR